MTRWAPTLALAALVALAALIALTSLRAPAEDRQATAQRIAAELRCPDCQSLSVAESQTRAAAEIRARIAAMLAEGRSPEQVIAYFRAQYGDGILLSPPSALPWLLPIVVAGLAIIGLVVWRHSLARTQSVEPPTIPDCGDAARRVREEAEALDA